MNFAKMKKVLLIVLLLLVSLAAYLYIQNEQTNKQTQLFWAIEDASNTQTIDHAAWQDILENYIETEHESGVFLFDYSSVDDEVFQQLENYIQRLANIDPRHYSRIEQKAYWINLYNALTVKLILENYPLDSITSLGDTVAAFGPWDDEAIIVIGQKLSLNNIEHQILRPIWNDARIHFAVNCASFACPNLQDNAFTAENMDYLLNKAASEYIVHPRGARFEKDKLILSSIFDWYAEDFGENKESILLTLSGYFPKDLATDVAEKIKNYQGQIDYEYDWILNDLELFEN